MKFRLILTLALTTAVGLLGALLLLQDQAPRSNPAAISEPLAKPDSGTSLPTPSERPTLPALPAATEQRTAQPMSLSESSPTQITGRVISRAGAPLVGAQVTCYQATNDTAWVRYKPTPHAETTDSEGRFRMIGVPSKGTLSLEVTHASAAPSTVEPLRLEPGQQLDVGDIALGQGVRLFGKVIDTNGVPVRGAQLIVSDMGRVTAGSTAPTPSVFAEAVTDALGEYTVEHLGRRQYTVEIHAEGFAPLQSAIAFMLNSPTGDYEQDFMLEDSSSMLGGIVLGPEEQPVEGAAISLLRRVPDNKSYYMLEEVTDARGRFHFDRIASGRYDVRFASTDWYLPLPLKLDAGNDQHVLRAQPAITVVGQVVTTGSLPHELVVTAKADARTGAQLLGDRPAERKLELTDRGTFDYNGLRSGSYVLTVNAPGFAPTNSQDLILGQETLRVPVTVILQKGGSVKGSLKDPSATAIIELRDSAWNPQGPLDFAFPAPPVHGLRVKSDKTGKFHLRNVPAGAYVLSVKTKGMPDLHVRDIEVSDNQVSHVGELVRQVGGHVGGMVTGTRGEPLGGASVSLAGPAARMRTTANLDGTFQFEAVPPGDYELVAVPKSFFEAFRFEAKQDITVTSDKEIEVSLFLTARTPTSKGN